MDQSRDCPSVSSTGMRPGSNGTSREDWTVVQPKVRTKQKYITKQKAFGLQRELDIMGLATLLLSVESRNLQEDGWIFEGIVKTNDKEKICLAGNVSKKFLPSKSYITLPVANKWDDQVVFSRTMGASN
jgi:hypothetical protein